MGMGFLSSLIRPKLQARPSRPRITPSGLLPAERLRSRDGYASARAPFGIAMMLIMNVGRGVLKSNWRISNNT